MKLYSLTHFHPNGKDVTTDINPAMVESITEIKSESNYNCFTVTMASGQQFHVYSAGISDVLVSRANLVRAVG